MELDDNNVTWPRRGDDPLALGDDWRDNACLNFMHGPQWYAMGHGFRLAADAAVEHATQKGRDHDYLVFPILANYRQFIELLLKGIIGDCRLLLDEPGDVPQTHSLEALWHTAKPLLLRVEPGSDPRDIRNVGDCLRRFHDLDPTSQETRYPVDRDGKPTLAGLQHVNLRQVRDVADRLGEFLELEKWPMTCFVAHEVGGVDGWAVARHRRRNNHRHLRMRGCSRYRTTERLGGDMTESCPLRRRQYPALGQTVASERPARLRREDVVRLAPKTFRLLVRQLGDQRLVRPVKKRHVTYRRSRLRPHSPRLLYARPFRDAEERENVRNSLASIGFGNAPVDQPVDQTPI